MKTYLTKNKPDDYNNCITELVETTPKIVKEYYWSKEVEPEDIETLKKYLNFTSSEEEKERSDERRFYGCN